MGHDDEQGTEGLPEMSVTVSRRVGSDGELVVGGGSVSQQQAPDLFSPVEFHPP